MDFIDIFDFSKYFKRVNDRKTAKIGHVNEVIETVNNLPIGSEYTETIVTITPNETTYSDGRPLVASGILSMGTTPIVLLPSPGENKYYEGYIIVEWNHGTVDYDILSLFLVCYGGITAYTIIDTNFLLNNQDYVFKSTNANGINGASYATLINYGVYMTTDDATNPTVGNGTLRVKVYHKTITFGA